MKGEIHMSLANNRPTRPALVIELTGLYDGHDVLAVVSRPGREGTLTRRWNTGRSSRLDAHQAEDVAAWVTQLVNEFITTTTGLQGVL